jgi:mannosyltransferase
MEETTPIRETVLISAASPVAHDATDWVNNSVRRPWAEQRSILLVAILFVASGLRLVQLGRSSLWYDEVVTMRLARTPNPAALVELLGQIDATRAPLHPLVLQRWIALFGPGDYSGRLFSCLCGIITIALVYVVGLRAFDQTTGLWAAWLSALCPTMVYYSREVRMYAWLVTITCLGWGAVFSHGRAPGHGWVVLYGMCLVALAYSHPLGLLMVVALALATLFFRHAFRLSWRAWVLSHLAAGLAILPWVGQYVGRTPELMTGPLPLRFLLGAPIGFIGGNFAVLGVCALLIAYGLCSVQRREDGRTRVVLAQPASAVSLLFWLVIPPVSLYVYSLVAHPIFGPARYTLFVAPAYLILVARGLGRLPVALGIAAAAACAFFSAAMLQADVYRPDLKADWKAAAAYLDRFDPSALVVVTSTDPSRNVEAESARYYLRPGRVVIAWPDRSDALTHVESQVWASIGLRDGHAVGALPPELSRSDSVREVVDFPGLRLMRIDLVEHHGRRIEGGRGTGGPDR